MALFLKETSKNHRMGRVREHQMINMPIFYQLVPVPREVLTVLFNWMVAGEMGYTHAPFIYGSRAEGEKNYLPKP